MKQLSNTREVHVQFRCLSYAKFEFSVLQFLRPAVECISLTLNKFNVNELILVLETTIKYNGSASILKMCGVMPSLKSVWRNF